MTRPSLLLAGLLLGAASLPAAAQDAPPLGAGLIGLNGEEIGTVSFRDTTNGVLIALEATGLPASQTLAFHIHEGDSCDTADAFDSAGGHFAPGSNAHGYLAEGGPHAGDMPNQFTDAEGNLKAEVFNPAVTVAEGEASIAGRTVMIHAGADDYMSQPSGDAGDRLACGVIE